MPCQTTITDSLAPSQVPNASPGAYVARGRDDDDDDDDDAPRTTAHVASVATTATNARRRTRVVIARERVA
jgi:hypothetical protein